ncbi:hypothetical protein ACFOY8_14460 [Thalassospira xianhensis]|uniref:Uncharacterized protein n=1 Tax=Thalassospira xianhensis MCCC 1A02616 TaxID=1177929 RepID=A0A367UH54_9PROT|nr:hypothetical protein [Thalassospira xianhensis]RCK07645.1 hypothetical protein TH5_00790 [Thalassospira xianhensis MCCC 1A02616]
MYSLVVAVLSIALGVGIALSTVYYGGRAYTASSAKAEALEIINAVQQIKAALAVRGLTTPLSSVTVRVLADEGYLSGPNLYIKNNPIRVIVRSSDGKGIVGTRVLVDEYNYETIDQDIPLCGALEALNGASQNDLAPVANGPQMIPYVLDYAHNNNIPFDCFPDGAPGWVFVFFKLT